MTRRALSRGLAGYRWLVAAIAIAALALSVTAANGASTITVTTTAQVIADDGACSLQEAILAANYDATVVPNPGDPTDQHDTGCAAGSGADTIVVPAGWTLTMTAPISDAANHVGPTATPIVTSPITIEANGARFVRLPGTESYRAFAVGSGGSLRLVEAHVKGFHAQGGRGAWGGGGGLGAGGAIYVHAGALTIDYSTFEGNGADGGRGSGTAPVGGGSGGGGGGGLGGTGGVGDHGGAGGGGSRGDGSDGFLSRGGSGGGRITSGTFSAPGAPCGGAGGDRLILAADGDDAACAGGGGGGGQQEDVFGVGNGGDGAYGGGGGGGGLEDGDGGHGGFGGGGGAGGQENPNAGTGGGSGGEGGFGAGGGSGRAGLVFGGPGAGGTFAGAGGSDSGGGGAALGGAIFGHEATVVIRNSTFTGNYVARGEAGGADADQGTDAGGAIFLVAGSLTVVHTTIAGNESTGEGAGLAVYKPTTGQATTLTLRNTIIAGNNGVRACFLRNGPTAIGSGNLIVPGGAFGAPLAPCPGIAITGDPALGSLQIEAPGRTPTMAIPLDSPATDAADPTPAFADDQRGAPRPLGAGYDVGAYEVGSFDTTAPAASPTQAPDANTNGWNNSVVTVTWNWTDAPGGSGIDAAHCTTSSSTSGEGATITLSATCADIAGNVGSASHTVKVDTTAPGGSPVALPAPNTNGWNNSAVTVTWNWTDTGGSGIETTNCATSSTTSGEGPAVMVSTSCSDLAGNAGTASRTANIDLTAPTVTCADPPRYVLGGAHAVDVTATVTDALSGPVAGGLAADVTAADVSTPGIKSKSLTGTDLAGNETTRSCAYVVQYAFLGFGEPVPQTQVKRGSRIPVKFRLGSASGAALTDAAAAALLAPVCLVRVTFDGDDRGCVAYDARTDTFQLDVKTSKSTSVGEHTIGIRVSAPDGSGVVNADSLTIGVRA